jgi:hypothetical protein
MKKSFVIFTAICVALGFSVLPASAEFKAPVFTLDRVEVASIQPFFVKPRVGYKSEKEKGKVGTYGYSSTLNVAYILGIKNPNTEAVMLDEITFTIAFDGFDVNTVTGYEDAWIPPGKTNQVRIVATNEAFPTIVSLMVGAQNVERIKQMKTSAGKMVGGWWKSIPDFSFPIDITNGVATFKDEKGNTFRTNFSAKWGKKPEGSGSKPKEEPKGKGSKAK